jgi:beta-lactamase class A
MTLNDEIARAAEGFKGVLGVSVKHMGTGETASLNGGELFPTASTFKVPVIVEFFRQVEAGRASLDERVVLRDSDKVPGSGILKELMEGLEVAYSDLLSLMMIVSDNTATDLVVEKVGRDNVNKTLRGLGLEKTMVVADCRDILFDLIGLNDLLTEKSRGTTSGGSWSLGTEHNDVTTPDEMTRLLEMIVRGEAATRESCDAVLDIMAKCQTGTYRIPKYLPKEVQLLHKTGSLPGIRNDVGVVTLGESGERYVISCFTKDAEDVYSAEEAIAQASLNAYNHLTKR